MNYWLHRISHLAEVSYPLLDSGFLTIGFSDFSDNNFIQEILSPETWEERWRILEQYFKDIWGEHPRTRHNLWRFIEGFKTGDWIIVPIWGQFSIYEIVGSVPQAIGSLPVKEVKDWYGETLEVKNLICNGQKEIDLGFYWEVAPIAKGISRYEYADAALTARLKTRTTNACINDIQSSIISAIASYQQNKPINFHSKIVDRTAGLILDTIKCELSPDKFERLVKWYFERIGASDVTIPPKNESGKEGDADVIATFEPIKTIIYAQVKFHKGFTSKWAVEQIVDYKRNKEGVNQSEVESMDDGYSKISWVISTSDGYHEDCINLAKEEKVQLIDGKKFSVMLLEAGITNINKL